MDVNSTLTYPTLAELRTVLTDPIGRRFVARLKEGPIPAHRPELGPCVLWARRTTKRGYAEFRIGDKTVSAHRWLYMRLHGAIPEGKQLHHLCHDPTTCKLSTACPQRACMVHTTPVTGRENILLGGSFAAVQAAKDRCECKHAPRDAEGNIIGHDLTNPANVYIQKLPNGRELRHCKEGMRESGREYQARRRARLRAQRPAAPVQLSLV